MSDTLEGEMDSLKFVIDQAENAGNKEEVSYLNGLTEKIQNGDTYTRGIMLRNMVEHQDSLKIQMVITSGCYSVMNITC